MACAIARVHDPGAAAIDIARPQERCENVFLNGEPAARVPPAFSSCSSRAALFILADTIECRTIRR
ncbi:hypothetical protein XmelCFBP4644_14855 [Xanthomonas melonis]|uniref:Uncharacterized protein n=1 Tax=Xanthomonas melonis TaxID=56456 RepID=A0A2S7DCR4_9XANT|nr:hypothetical protein XmelCFBP4644_14855 [Xanthomonas melonis]